MSNSNLSTDYIYVPLHVELYADLIRRSGEADVSRFIEHCVESFLDNTEGDPGIWSEEYIEKIAEEEEDEFWTNYGNPNRGYQWTTLSLPNGTKIRMTYGGENYYAEIRHESFCYGKERMSPSQFARRVANNTSRNAWRDLYIRFLGDGSWKSAESLRRIKPF